MSVVSILSGAKRFLHTKEAVIFLFAFVVHVATFITLWWWFRVTGHMPDPNFAFPVLGGDSADYFLLTENLRHNGIFSSSLEAPFIPESFRVPGYSFFLYFFTFIPFSYVSAMIAQIVLAALSCVLLYRIGKKFLSEKVALIASVAFALEPTSLFFSTIIMSDTLFVFVLLLSIYILLNPPKNKKLALLCMFAAGALMGFAVLVRAIALYLAPCLILGFLVLRRKELKPYSHTALSIAAYAIGLMLVVLPWAMRQHHWFNTYTLSSTPYINFTQYNLVYFYQHQHGVSYQEARNIYADPIPYERDSLWFRSLVNEEIFKEQMKEGLSGNLIPYIGFHAVKTLPFFLNDSLRDINRMTGIFPTQERAPNFTDLLLKRDFGAIANYFLSLRADVWMLIVGSLVWILISVLAIGGTLWAMLARRKEALFMCFALGIVFYFALLSSPVIQPRYRMPAAPFMLLLAAHSTVLLSSAISKRLAQKPREAR